MTGVTGPLASLLEGLLVAVVGLCLGSLVGLVSHRLPRDQAVVLARSRCPRCGNCLAPRDLIPLVSFLALDGRCRHCGAPLSWRYPAIELVGAALCLAIWASADLTVEAVLAIGLATTLLTIAISDLETLIIPDELVVVCFLLGFADLLLGGGGDLVDRLGGLALAVGPVVAVRQLFSARHGRHGIGLGDVKLFAAAGFWLGVEGVPWLFVIAGGIGVLTALVWRVRGQGPMFPFGIGIAAGWFVLSFPM